MSKIKHFGMVIDQGKCIGCEACSLACRIENNSTEFWIKVEPQGGKEEDAPAGKYQNLTLSFLPKLCNHCSNPPCADACPVEALQKRDDGPVILDQDLCIGCKACLEACPYDVIVFNEKSKLAEKCNLCVDRIDEGLEPFCVICCEGQVLHFGDLNDPTSKVSQLLLKRTNFQLKPEMGTNPSIYYLSPKPKREL
jgi:Fe-S-cluster-containing dehydrogenase component